MIKTIIIFLTTQIIFGQCVKGDCYDKNGKYILRTNHGLMENGMRGIM